MFIISKLIKVVVGSRNQRVIKKLNKIVQKINAFEPILNQLSDIDLKNKTAEFKQRFVDGEKLDSILPEAFAVVREASQRTVKMRHFDVQLIGGIVLHKGKIAEMCTGEGKTLVATLPAYLNALTSKSVHIVTVNDYLAKRDAAWMGPVYQFLGLTVGVNLPDMGHKEKKLAYAADITYGTNNEFGFDYLRDNMAFSQADKVQRDLNYAIVDEVDSILIDEARTPLIISGATDERCDLYVKINKLIPKLTKRETENASGDYYLEEKHKQAYLTEQGHNTIEKLLVQTNILEPGASLYDPKNIRIMHYINAALRAHFLFARNVDYIVTDNQVVIIDEHTGRAMPGRRWSDGLHQAIEAKEGVQIQNENQTLATITFQNYFRLYNKLAGMTGTADTEAYEFHQIYGLEVIVIPTNMPLIRKDFPDRVYITAQEKFKAIIEDIKECIDRSQPVLVGTASIDHSEKLSNMLKKANIKHSVLNAKLHEKEAHIITQAGKPGMVTIATNMAGRGTDIVLGGNLEAQFVDSKDIDGAQKEEIIQAWHKNHKLVIKVGGLHVIGSERHESRRIDNQLRGRSGRQGDPGSSRFYISLEDNLMRIFASDRMGVIMKRLGMQENDAIEHKWVSRAIENAQRKVEGFNFDIRKQLLEYDDVANDQRKVIYEQRNELMETDDISQTITAIMQDVINRIISIYIPQASMEEQWDIAGLEHHLKSTLALDLPLQNMLTENENLNEEEIIGIIYDKLLANYKDKEALAGKKAMRQFEKSVMLQCLDMHWKEHLKTMEQLRQSIGLSGYAQKNPKQEYKRESFVLFANMLNNIKNDVVAIVSSAQIQQADAINEYEEQLHNTARKQNLHFHHQEPTSELDSAANTIDAQHAAIDKTQPARRIHPKIGRNDPCFCGSNKKYKQCCGKLE